MTSEQKKKLTLKKRMNIILKLVLFILVSAVGIGFVVWCSYLMGDAVSIASKCLLTCGCFLSCVVFAIGIIGCEKCVSQYIRVNEILEEINHSILLENKVKELIKNREQEYTEDEEE